MKAFVIEDPGGPEALQLKDIPDPEAPAGQVRIGIKAFGLNRAEAVTRMGGSGKAVQFPRVIGIECVGTVLDCPGGELEVGQTVAAAMGEMGRAYDGSYAEQTVVPVSNVFPVDTGLDWTTFAAIPETYFTAWGCCFRSLKLDREDSPKVFVRPGASALAIAITQIVNALGGQVIGVTRSPHKMERMISTGMKKAIVSSETTVREVLEIWPEGADGVVDTVVSKVSLKEDLALRSKHGRICLAGSLADSYATERPGSFAKALVRPRVGFYDSGTIHVKNEGKVLQEIVDRVEKGVYQAHIDSVFSFEELPTAHQRMDENAFTGKVVIRVDVS